MEPLTFIDYSNPPEDLDSLPSHVVTAPEGTVVLVYGKAAEGTHASVAAFEPYTRSVIKHQSLEIQYDHFAILLSKKDRTVIQTFGAP
ncbi:MAG: hypothetical protein MN733_02580 [Nitrososphaera sp.]|nr:hypothetical protein [Nitrososphaera sp.]